MIITKIYPGLFFAASLRFAIRCILGRLGNLILRSTRFYSVQLPLAHPGRKEEMGGGGGDRSCGPLYCVAAYVDLLRRSEFWWTDRALRHNPAHFASPARTRSAFTSAVVLLRLAAAHSAIPPRGGHLLSTFQFIEYGIASYAPNGRCRYQRSPCSPCFPQGNEFPRVNCVNFTRHRERSVFSFARLPSAKCWNFFQRNRNKNSIANSSGRFALRSSYPNENNASIP